jgi:hypothetical protein
MKELLLKLDACKPAIEWAGEKTWEEIYKTCRRGDWLLWLFKETNPDDLKALTLAKGHCANTVRHLMKDERSIKAVDDAIAFGEGKISEEALASAVSAASASAYASAYAYAYAYAYASASAYAYAYAYASASAYAASAYASAASASAAYAAYASAASASDASAAYAASAYAYDASARKENQRLTADICRKYLPMELFNINH